MILFHMDDLHRTFHLSSLTVLVFHLFLTHVCKGQSELIGSSQPIVATLGEDVVLPCHLQPAEDATDLTVEWTRPDLSPRFVHVRRSRDELVDKKHASFKGRTSLFIDELKKGNISLKLSKVKLSDEGKYKCFIPLLKKETFVQLRFPSVPVSSPVISLSGMDRDRGGVVLQCESAGWYPEPEVLWLDAEGNLLSAGPPETVRGPDDLYTVSSRVTVDKRHNNSFTCRVQQNNINQTRETHIHVPDDFFLSSSSSAVPIITGLAVSLAVSIMVILAGVFFVWRQNTTKTKKISRDEAERGEKLLTEETVKMKVLEETDFSPSTSEMIQVHVISSSQLEKIKPAASRCSWFLRLFSSYRRMEEEVKQLTGDKTKLQQEKHQLQEELETRDKELKETKDEVGKLTGDNKKLQEEKNHQQEELETRNKELKEKQDEVEKLTDDKTKLQQEKQQLQEELETRDKEMKEIKDELEKNKAAASISIWFLRSSSSKKMEEINQLKGKNHQLLMDLVSRNKDLDKTKEELKEKTKEVGRLTGDKTNLQQEIQRKENELETRNKELKEKTDEINQLKEENHQLLMDLVSRNKDLDKTKDALKKKTEEVKQLTGDNRKLHEEKQQKEKELETRNKELETRTKKLKEKQDEVEKLTGDKTKLQQEKQQKEKELNNRNKELKEKQDEVEKLTDDKTKLQQEKQHLKKELETRNNELETRNKELKEKQDEVNELNEENHQLKKELGTRNKELKR